MHTASAELLEKGGDEDGASTEKQSCRTVYRLWTTDVYSVTNIDRY